MGGRLQQGRWPPAYVCRSANRPPTPQRRSRIGSPAGRLACRHILWMKTESQHMMGISGWEKGGEMRFFFCFFPGGFSMFAENVFDKNSSFRPRFPPPPKSKIFGVFFVVFFTFLVSRIVIFVQNTKNSRGVKSSPAESVTPLPIIPPMGYYFFVRNAGLRGSLGFGGPAPKANQMPGWVDPFPREQGAVLEPQGKSLLLNQLTGWWRHSIWVWSWLSLKTDFQN